MLFERHLLSFRSWSMLWFLSVLICWFAMISYSRCLIGWIQLLTCSYMLYTGKPDVFLMIEFCLYYLSDNLLISVIWVGLSPLIVTIYYNLYLFWIYSVSRLYINGLAVVIDYILGLKWSQVSIHFYELPIHWFLRQNTSLTPWLGRIHGINCISWFYLLRC